MSRYQRLLAAVAAGAFALVAAVGCGDTSTSPQTVSGGSSTAPQDAWQCPSSPTDKAWPANSHTDPDILVPQTPLVAYQCTYQTTLSKPSEGVLVGQTITFTGSALSDLINSFNTAGPPGQMSCPAGQADQVVQNTKYNFTYPDGGSAIVDRLGANCPTITNGTLTKQAPNSPSSTEPAP